MSIVVVMFPYQLLLSDMYSEFHQIISFLSHFTIHKFPKSQ